MPASRIVAALFAVSLLAVPPLFAQQGTSQISGKVTDDQGAVLPGVAILVTNEESGVFREVTTSIEGTYFVSQIQPGRYKIVAKLTGFRTVERAGLVAQVGTTMTMNLSLPVGGVEESVTVTGSLVFPWPASSGLSAEVALVNSRVTSPFFPRRTRKAPAQSPPSASG